MAADDRLEHEHDELARRLREAHRRVRALSADPAVDRERLARRYLAICDLAKHDPRRAAARLDAFLSALDTPRDDENTLGD
ncbi:hypothetical protein [Nonomuraea sp. NPDC050783]|uniref:hypothetical protein n=1 Tax=Nonomuraea sp. NPDC050783 TaxID=3154634 RepID=UPI0034662CB5